MTTAKTRKGVGAKSRKRAADDPEQYKRFREFAREHEADDDNKRFDSTLEKLIRKVKPN
jgi:hypothetical protein